MAKTRNPLRLDPSRTGLLRRQFEADMMRRWAALHRAVVDLVVKDDVFGLKDEKPAFGPTSNMTANAGKKAWQFETDPGKVKAFQKWFREQVNEGILQVDRTRAPWTAKYVESAYKKGMIRAYTDAKPQLDKPAGFYQGSQRQFLESAFARPERVSKLELLSTRTYEQLKGITDQMSGQIGRVLADGIAHGKNPNDIARTLTRTIDGMSKNRARTLARTEIIHAHAEGQLDAFEEMGEDNVEVMAEWTITDDDRLCDLCEPLGGTVLTIEEARGLIPRHPNCRCAWVPANVGETDKVGRATSKRLKEKRFKQSIQAEKPNASAKKAKEGSTWLGKEKTLHTVDIDDLTDNQRAVVNACLAPIEHDIRHAVMEDDGEHAARLMHEYNVTKARLLAGYGVQNYDPDQARDEKGQWTAEAAVAAKYGMKPAAESKPAFDEKGKPRLTKSGDPIMTRTGKGSKTLDGRPIPPAWTHAYVADDPDADVQAVGRDAKGRTQRMYSEAFTKAQGDAKFERITSLERDRDALFKKTALDAKTSEPAAVLRLIQQTGIRPGSEKDTKSEKQAYGATTLRGEHVVERDGGVVLEFVGKKGVDLAIPVDDKATARDLLARAKAAGKSGKLFDASDADLREYVSKISDGAYKPKDFRTLKGTSTARELVKGMDRATDMKDYKAKVMDVATQVSAKLGNTPVVALQSYINPRVFDGIKPIGAA